MAKKFNPNGYYNVTIVGLFSDRTVQSDGMAEIQYYHPETDELVHTIEVPVGEIQIKQLKKEEVIH